MAKVSKSEPAGAAGDPGFPLLGHVEHLVDWLAAYLRRKRDEARQAAAGKGATANTLGRLGAWWGLREEVVEARDAVGPLLADSVHRQLDAFAEQADHVAGRQKAVGSRQNA